MFVKSSTFTREMAAFLIWAAYYERKTFKTEQNKLESNVLICYLKITTAALRKTQ